MGNLWNWIKRAFGASKAYYVRWGLDRFLGQYIAVAVEEVVKLGAVHNNKDLVVWVDDLRDAVINRIGKPVADNWITILIAHAFEHLKAIQPGVAKIKVE